MGTANPIADADELDAASRWARSDDHPTVVAGRTDAGTRTEGGSYWDIGVPQVSARAEVVATRAGVDAGKTVHRVRS